MERDIVLVTEKAELLSPLCAVMQTIFQQHPHVVSPDAILEKIRATPCDLLIVDLSARREWMPMLSQLKQAFPAIPIIAMVPYGDIILVEQALEAGADDYISQPIALERLKVCLRNALRLRQMLLGQQSTESRVLQGVDVAVLFDPFGGLRSLQEVEMHVIEHAVRHHGGCMSKAAQALGIGRSTLYRKMQLLPSSAPLAGAEE